MLKGLLPYLPLPPYGGVVSEEVVAAASTPYEKVSYARKNERYALLFACHPFTLLSLHLIRLSTWRILGNIVCLGIFVSAS